MPRSPPRAGPGRYRPTLLEGFRPAFHRGSAPTELAMKRKANICAIAVALVCALTYAEVGAQAITVTPASPTISVGQTQQFTAGGAGGVTAVDLGAFYSCALLQDGTVRCWGQNDLGQLGNGTSDPVPNNPSTFNPTPVTVSGITTAVAISAGGWHTCALLQDGTVRCWGDNTYGQMGNGATLVSPSPPPPITPTATPAAAAGATSAGAPC